MRRAAVVEDDPRLAAGTENPADLGERGGDVGRVMEDAVREHHVEALVRERHALCIALDDGTFQTERGEVCARELGVPRCQIDAGDASSALCEPDEIDALAAADIEHVQIASPRVVECFGHPR